MIRVQQKETAYRTYSSVKEKEIDWLWYPYIPYGKLTLLQGDPGDGKSTFMINLAAILSRGGNLPDGEIVEKQVVIYQCAEDSPEDTIKPRLIRASADCDNVLFIEEKSDMLTLMSDEIEETIAASKARLLIFDPLQAFLPQDGDMQSAVRMRGIMRRLSKVAEKNQCAIVMIGHMTKSTSGKSLYRGPGSIDIAAIARSVLMIERDEADPSIRYMFQVKSSLAPEGDAIGFLFDQERGFQWIGKCKREKEPEQVTEYQHATKRDKAASLLEIMLSSEDLSAKDIFSRMEKIGIGERTVRDAKKDISVTAYKKNNVWYWTISNAQSKKGSDHPDGADRENVEQRVTETEN